MFRALALATLLAALLPFSTAQSAVPAGLSTRQATLWTNADALLDDIANNKTLQLLALVNPNVTMDLVMNPGFIQAGGSWWGQNYQGFFSYAKAIAGFGHVVPTSRNGVVRPVGVDDDHIYIAGTRTITVGSNTVHNITLAGVFTFDSNALLIHGKVYWETASFAEAGCPSGKLTCSIPSEPVHTDVTESSQVTLDTFSSSPVAPTPADQANLATLVKHWQALASNNLTEAAMLLEPSVVTTFFGPSSIVPIAGSASGISGWTKLTESILGSVTNRELRDLNVPSCVGGSDASVGGTCVAVWDEYSYTKLPLPRVIDGLTNIVTYHFSASNLIDRIDIHTNSLEYGIRFCEGFLRCE